MVKAPNLIKRPIRRFDSCCMHLECSVQSLLTEFIHIARPYSLWGTSLAQHSFKTSTRSSLARERKGIDDWKSRLEIATIVRVGVPIHHLRRGLVLPSNYGWSVGLKPPLDSATKDEITIFMSRMFSLIRSPWPGSSPYNLYPKNWSTAIHKRVRSSNTYPLSASSNYRCRLRTYCIRFDYVW